MNRAFQIVLITSTLAFSWLSMIALHELGHVLTAAVSGGKVKQVVLAPTWHARTDLTHNPHPLLVAWGGGLWGSFLPLVIWAALRLARNRFAWLATFWAGFCCVANGAYLAAGACFPSGAGDSADLLRQGAARWQLALFGLPTAAFGCYLFNGLGLHFGIGPRAGHVDRRAAIGMTAALVVLAASEWFTLSDWTLAMQRSIEPVEPSKPQGANEFLPAGEVDRGWPFVRGPNYDGHSPEIELAEAWPAHPARAYGRLRASNRNGFRC